MHGMNVKKIVICNITYLLT